MASPPLPMAADSTFSPPGRPSSLQPPSLTRQETQAGAQERDPETWHLIFRMFDPSEPANPLHDLRVLSQLCSLWLRPDLHTKEEILDQLVLEQFMICMPPDLQALVKESGVKSCKDLEEVLKNQGNSQETKTWSIITLRGQQFLVKNTDAQTNNEIALLDRYSSSESQVQSWQASPQPQNLPGTRRPGGQGEEFLPETIPGKEAPKDLRCRQNLVKNLLEDQEKDTALTSPEPQLLQSPAGSTSRKNRKKPQEETSMKNVDPGTPPTPVLQREVLAENWPDPLSLRNSKRRPHSTPTPQEEPHEKALCLDTGEFSGYVRLNQSDALQPDSHSDSQKGPGQAQHKCRVCEKSFVYKSQFIIHQRTHTGERPFRCSICTKGFMQASDLRVHQRTHTGEKPFECSVCHKKFAHESTLHGHRRVHTKERPYRCEDCEMTFSHKGNLNVHRRIHTDSKPYKCPVCGHTFRQQGTFNRHKRIHEKRPSQPLHDQI